jgi:hypothetical protein
MSPHPLGAAKADVPATADDGLGVASSKRAVSTHTPRSAAGKGLTILLLSDTSNPDHSSIIRLLLQHFSPR